MKLYWGIIVISVMAVGGWLWLEQKRWPFLQNVSNQMVVDDHGVKKIVFDNGFTLAMLPRPGSHKVFLQMTYRVGSAQEQRDIKGIAHVIEHMLFKGTTRYAERDIPALARLHGGRMNAATSLDFTWYYVEVPAGNWHPFLEIFADCMVNARFDEQHLASELKTIMREVMMTRDAHKKAMNEYMFEMAYPAPHPYHYRIGGYVDMLPSITVDDVRSFYERFYRPDNATLYVVGDFDQNALLEAVQKTLGIIPRPQKPLPETVYPRFERRALGHEKLINADIAREQLFIFWAIPGLTYEHEDAFSVLAHVLAHSGLNSLHKRLVGGKRLAHRVRVRAPKHLHGGLFIISCEPKKGRAHQCRQEILQILRDVVEQGWEQRVLQHAVLQKQRMFFQMQTDLRTCVRNWNKTVSATGDVGAYFHRYDLYKGVTQEMLKDCIDRYMQEDFMYTLHVVPRNATQRKISRALRRQRSVQDSELLKKNTRSSSLENISKHIQQMEPPYLVPQLNAPDYVITTANGLTVVVAVRKQFPLVHVACGACDDGLFQNQYDRHMMEIILKALIIEGKYAMKNVPSFTMRYDNGMLLGSALADDGNSIIEGIFSLIQTVHLSPRSVDIAKRQWAKDYQRRYKSPRARLLQEIYRQIFYEKKEPKAVASWASGVTLDELNQAKYSFWRPDRLVVSIVGDVDVSFIKKVVQMYGSGERRRVYVKKRTRNTFNGSCVGQDVDIQMNTSTITCALCKDCPISSSHDDYQKLRLLDYVFFRGWGSRIFSLREEFGLFYTSFGAVAHIVGQGRGYSYWGAVVTPESVDEAEQHIRDEITHLYTHGMKQWELTAAKQLFLKKNIDEYDDYRSYAILLCQIYAQGKTFDDMVSLMNIVGTFTSEQMFSAIRSYVNPDGLVRIRIGNFSQGLSTLDNANG